MEEERQGSESVGRRVVTGEKREGGDLNVLGKGGINGWRASQGGQSDQRMPVDCHKRSSLDLPPAVQTAMTLSQLRPHLSV